MGLCSICGKPDAMFTCSLCGRLVCRNCFDMHNSVCCFCASGKN
ncbi:MAG: orotate phosphoribosyltransferase [Thermoplasmatota archaeon]